MLDEVPLSAKLTVVQEWFRRSGTGEFEFTTRHRDTFSALLAQCQQEAVKLEAQLPSPPSGDRLFAKDGEALSAQPASVPDEFRHEGFLEDMAFPSNVVPLARAGHGRRAGGPQ